MNNKYRQQYVEKVEQAIENGEYVHTDIINQCVQFITDAINTLKKKKQTVINKEKRRLEKEDKELTLQGV